MALNVAIIIEKTIKISASIAIKKQDYRQKARLQDLWKAKPSILQADD